MKALMVWNLWQNKNQGHPFVMQVPFTPKTKPVFKTIKAICDLLEQPIE